MAVPKSAMKRIGYFGEEGYMTLGDPYKTKVVGEAPTKPRGRDTAHAISFACLQANCMQY